MAIDIAALERVLDAGHPDKALVGLPISLVREMTARLRLTEPGFAQLPSHSAPAAPGALA